MLAKRLSKETSWTLWNQSRVAMEIIDKTKRSNSGVRRQIVTKRGAETNCDKAGARRQSEGRPQIATNQNAETNYDKAGRGDKTARIQPQSRAPRQTTTKRGEKTNCDKEWPRDKLRPRGVRRQLVTKRVSHGICQKLVNEQRRERR